MAVGLRDAPEVGEELTRLARIQGLRQLARDHAYIRAHARSERVVSGVHDDPEDLR